MTETALCLSTAGSSVNECSTHIILRWSLRVTIRHLLNTSTHLRMQSVQVCISPLVSHRPAVGRQRPEFSPGSGIRPAGLHPIGRHTQCLPATTEDGAGVTHLPSRIWGFPPSGQGRPTSRFHIPGPFNSVESATRMPSLTVPRLQPSVPLPFQRRAAPSMPRQSWRSHAGAPLR
jgi:hypothetical protein